MNSVFKNNKNQETKAVTLKNAPRFEENPFTKQASQYIKPRKRTVVKGGKAVMDVQTGELENIAEIVQVENVDTEQFIKLYTGDLKRFFSLRPTSVRLLQVVLNLIQKNKDEDTVTLNVKLTQRYFEKLDIKPMSKSAFYIALNEMLNKGFLARSGLSEEQFYINTMLFFNGDRMRLIKEYQIRRQLNILDKTNQTGVESGRERKIP